MWTVVLLQFCLIQRAVSVVVNTPSGPVQGSPSPLQPDVNRFLGVPFANPPVRFAKPEMVTPWTDVYDATSFRPACFQGVVAEGMEISEDCLFVDIYVLGGTAKSDDLKAVMVWIYGGAFVVGYSEQYEGSLLAKTGDVIVVAINYRLGVFGWMYNGGITPANLGLWDQKLALEWVQANIQAFGGDKDQVTVFGESAGSISVSCLMLSPQINNTHFQRAILQSGSFLMGDPSELFRDSTYGKLIKETGCDRFVSVESQLTCLRQQPAGELHSLTESALFLPTHDEEFLLKSSLEIISEYGRQGASEEVMAMIGNIQQYDALIGYNGQEGYLLLAPVSIILGLDLDEGISNLYYGLCTSMMLATMRQSSQRKFLQSNYDEELPGKTRKENNMHNLLDMLGDYIMAMPAVNTAYLHADVATTFATDKKTYVYMYDHIPSMGSVVIAGPEWLQTSASHGDDVMFTVGVNLPEEVYPLTAEEKEFRNALMMYWSNFAKTGDPKTEEFSERGGQPWQTFTSSNPNYMKFTLDQDVQENDPRSGKRVVWQQIYNATHPDLDDLTTTEFKHSSSASTEEKYVPDSIFNWILQTGLSAVSRAISRAESHYLPKE